jgi:hypothetical protein
MRTIVLLLMAGGLWAQDNHDERYLAKYQAIQRKEREIIAKWMVDCRARMVGGTLQKQGDLIVCLVPPPPTPPASTPAPTPKTEEPPKK